MLAGLLALVLNYGLLRAADDRVRVAVAARPLVAGEPFDTDAVRFADVAVDDALRATLVEPDGLSDLAGHVVATSVPVGDPLRRSDLRPPSAPDGRRAMSLPVPAEHAVAGRLQRGDRVDVIEVRDGAASYVLTGAEVLAVAGGDGGLAGGSVFSVTVAVDADSALALAETIRSESIEVVRSTGAEALPDADDRSDRREADAGTGEDADVAPDETPDGAGR